MKKALLAVITVVTIVTMLMSPIAANAQGHRGGYGGGHGGGNVWGILGVILGVGIADAIIRSTVPQRVVVVQQRQPVYQQPYNQSVYRQPYNQPSVHVTPREEVSIKPEIWIGPNNGPAQFRIGRYFPEEVSLPNGARVFDKDGQEIYRLPAGKIDAGTTLY